MTVTIIELTRNIVLFQETPQKRFKLKSIWKNTKCFRLKTEFIANIVMNMQDQEKRTVYVQKCSQDLVMKDMQKPGK